MVIFGGVSILLSKNAKLVFKHLKLHSDQKMAYQYIVRDLSLGPSDVKSACHQLILAGLATEYDYAPMPGGGAKPWGISLTEEGRSSRKYFWLKVGNFLFRSIITPIIVAFITTMVTLWVQGMFVAK